MYSALSCMYSAVSYVYCELFCLQQPSRRPLVNRSWNSSKSATQAQPLPQPILFFFTQKPMMSARKSAFLSCTPLQTTMLHLCMTQMSDLSKFARETSWILHFFLSIIIYNIYNYASRSIIFTIFKIQPALSCIWRKFHFKITVIQWTARLNRIVNSWLMLKVDC